MCAQIIDRLADVAPNYDVLFCDVWGVVHNGIAPFAAAVDALQAFRANGGRVVLLTNAPRPRVDIERQLDSLGVPRDAWDAVATSGDATRVALFSGIIGTKVYFMGEPRDLSVLDPLRLLDDPLSIEITDLEAATGILCAGPEDPRADPDTWRAVLLSAKARGLTLLCLNPDLVVDRGESREYCAGSVAKMYEEMGGDALYFGKPHPPIYDLARRRLAALEVTTSDERILCIGDGLLTDLPGAMGEGLDCLFVTGGLAAEETRTDRDPDRKALDAILAQHQTTATFAIGQLR
ncbi:MAG: TIGR01459 family HAD-type hydrolase [Pseudomonadota bacterium]